MQAAALAQLRSLRMDWPLLFEEDVEFLPQLTNLERLHLRASVAMPAELSQLTLLCALSLTDLGRITWEYEDEDESAEYGAIVQAALPHLTRLTFLALSAIPGMAAPPVALTALTSLQTFVWDGGRDSEWDAWLDPSAAALPAGGWLCGLRQLATQPNVLLGTLSQPGLAAALQQLAYVGMLHFGGGSAQHMADALCCAVQLPHLKVLLVETDSHVGPDDAWAAALLYSSLSSEAVEALPDDLRYGAEPRGNIHDLFVQHFWHG